MKAIILAAGRGSRMKHLTDSRPKCLVELQGRPLLEWQLDALKAAGIKEIGIVTGYKREMLATQGLTEFHNPRWADTNMVASLVCADEWLKESDCIVSYSDIFYETNAVTALMQAKGTLHVLYDANWKALWERRFGDPLLDAETFRLKQDGTLAEIGNKPRTVDEIQGQYMGLLRFTKEAWAEVTTLRAELTEKERDTMHMTGTLQKIIEAGRIAISAVAYKGKWGEVDSAEDLAVYQDEAIDS